MNEPDLELRARAEERLGTVVRGKYRLERILGIGGMGTVYEARHRNSARFAVKILHFELCARPSVRKRLQQEGYAANAVNHAGVVRVVDDDVTEDGAAFLVMDLLEGASVESVASDSGGSVSAEVAVAIVLQTLETLAAAHATRIIHRDIKPANLFVTTAGVVKLLDFGIARALDGPEASAQLTGSGIPLGTPSYMAPEQALARPEDFDARTDVWEVGATLFALISGRMVHEAETAAGVLVKAATVAAPRLLSVAPGTHAAIADVVDRALAFDRKERWASAREMADALDRARRAAGLAVLSSAALAKVAIPRLAPISSKMDPFGPTEEPAAVGPQGEPTSAPVSHATPPAGPGRPPVPRSWVRVVLAGVAAVLLLGTGRALWLQHARAPAQRAARPAPPISAPDSTGAHERTRVLLLRVTVDVAEPLIDRTLDRLLESALQASTALDPYAGSRVDDLVKSKAPNDPAALARELTAQGGGPVVVVRGTVNANGQGYRLALRATRPGDDSTIAVLTRDATDMDHIVSAATQLARDLRDALGDHAEDPELAGGAGLSESLEADHDFALAKDLVWSGQVRPAVALLERAIVIDPNFNAAHWELATAFYNSGRFADATHEYELAARPGHISRRARLQVVADYQSMLAHYDAAIAAYQQLADSWPDATSVRACLAETYVLAHQPRRALEIGRPLALAHPRNMVLAENVSVYELLGGNFEAALAASVDLFQAFPHPSPTASTARGVSLALLGRGNEAAASYRAMEPSNPALAAYDLADLALFEGRRDEAATELARYVAHEQLAGSNEEKEAAHAWAMLAEMELDRGHRSAALAAADKAAATREPWAVRSAGLVYLRARDEKKAASLASLLSENLGPDTSVVAKLFSADTLRSRRDRPESLRTLQEALRIADAWMVHFELARAYVASGDVGRARTELEECMRRRGEGAIAYTSYEIPTLRHVREASDLLARLPDAGASVSR